MRAATGAMADEEKVACPGNGDVEQPALLRQVIRQARRIHGVPWRDSFLRARDEHDRELQALGRVECQESHLLRGPRPLAFSRAEGNTGEETAEVRPVFRREIAQSFFSEHNVR